MDDEPGICRSLTIGFSRRGFDVRTSRTGDGAVRLLKQEPFDVMVVDLRLPDMRGDTVYEFAKSIRPELTQYTLFITGDITDRAERIIEACHCPLLRKPFDLHDIVKAVMQILPRQAGDASA
ncbi:MAG TPA: response regulator [Gemmatimonadaceae bacterium]|nr:response regulator [Gemmatimonadaceae bacterium]